MNEPGLWAWFLFESGLSTQRAKELLTRWDQRAWSLPDVVERLPRSADRFSLTAEEARLLHPPGLLPHVNALTWHDTRYPEGLRDLPLKLRPALLFYKGDPALLTLPRVYLKPASLTAAEEAALREILNLLIGETVLFAAYEGTTQAQILVEELTYGQGEAVLFAASGLARCEPPEQELALLDQGRLVLTSPLPANTPPRSAWRDILQQVAAAAATRFLISGALKGQDMTQLSSKPALAVSWPDDAPPPPPNVKPVTSPSEVFAWVASTAATSAAPREDEGGDPGPAGEAAYGLPEDKLGPPPSAEEIIETLSLGGKIPDVLRRRLTDNTD